VVDEPGGISLGYLRKGSIARVLERRLLTDAGLSGEAWILVEGNYRGWLRETSADIYPLAVQAETAAKLMIQ
jgi:hypothetical protein